MSTAATALADLANRIIGERPDDPHISSQIHALLGYAAETVTEAKAESDPPRSFIRTIWPEFPETGMVIYKADALWRDALLKLDRLALIEQVATEVVRERYGPGATKALDELRAVLEPR
jgi:hypothetical protein